MRARHRSSLALSVVGAALLGGESSSAAACVQDAPVTNDCRLDLVVGPVLMSNRATSMGGAYAGIAEGSDGYAVNAAAPGARTAQSHDWFDYDWQLGITFPSAFRNVDFENRGRTTEFRYDHFYFLTFGATLQFGPWGFGVSSDLQHYDLNPGATGDQPSFTATVSKTHALIARQFFGGDLVIGAGLRLVGLSFSRTDPGGASVTVASLAGTAPEVGVLIRPATLPLRIGATFRMPVTGVPAPDGASAVYGMVVPQSANLPWEVDFGIALQLGDRPLNPRWQNPHDDVGSLDDEIAAARLERATASRQRLEDAPRVARKALEVAEALLERRLRAEEDRALAELREEVSMIRKRQEKSRARDSILLSGSMLITGPTHDGISLESYFRQIVARSGRLTTFSPRAGVEVELLPNYLKLRLGAYVEPTRFGAIPDATAFRGHATAGFDLALFRWSAFGILESDARWQLTTVADLAPRYSNYGLSLGIWH
jgi:hypothetical protein